MEKKSSEFITADLLDEDKPIANQKFCCLSFLSPEKILKNIANRLISSKNRYYAHSKIKPEFERLCKDRTFIFDALQNCISKASFWEKPDNLVFPLYLSGDIIISINLFVPIRDKSIMFFLCMKN